MKLPKDFSNLDALLKRMGVPFKPFVALEIEASGITVESIDDVKVAQNGTLEYRGRKVVLHIRDIRDVKHKLPKYHVVDCQTLKDMRSGGRYKRYVVTRQTDGEFSLNFPNNDPRNNQETHRLDICQHCLGQLKLKETYPVDAFPLADWFDAIDPSYQPPPIEPLYDGPRTTPTPDEISKYPPNWNLLSRQCRKWAEWKCKECGIDLKLDTQFLHAHHLKGTQYNQPKNLKALCIGCHAEQPRGRHQLLKHYPEYQEFVKKYGDTWRQLTRKVNNRSFPK